MVVAAHDTSFYHNQILKSKYGVDNEAIKVSADVPLTQSDYPSTSKSQSAVDRLVCWVAWGMFLSAAAV